MGGPEGTAHRPKQHRRPTGTRCTRRSRAFDRAAKIAACAPPGSLNQGELRALVLDEAAAGLPSASSAPEGSGSGATHRDHERDHPHTTTLAPNFNKYGGA